MKIFLFNFKNIYKSRKFYVGLVFIFIVIFGFYFYNNALSFDNHNIISKYEILQQPTTVTAVDPTMPENGVPETGFHIHINLDLKQIYVYKDGHYYKSYPCSGGKSLTPSPEGTWKIIGKAEWGEGFGGAWMGLNVPWGQYGIHGTIYPWVIGKSNSSKGCIRMLSKDAQELYQYIPYGTTVTIIHENKVFRTLQSGDVGSDVVELESNLYKLGYYKGSMDGVFGNALHDSLVKFQQENKIYSSGRADRKTIELLRVKVLEYDPTSDTN